MAPWPALEEGRRLEECHSVFLPPMLLWARAEGSLGGEEKKLEVEKNKYLGSNYSVFRIKSDLGHINLPLSNLER